LKLIQLTLLLFLFAFSAAAQDQSFYQTLDTIQKLRELASDSNLEFKERLVHAKYASELSHETGVDTTILLSDRKVGFIYLNMSDADQIFKWSHRNLKLAKKLNDSLVLSYINHHLGWYYSVFQSSEKQQDSAFYYLLKAAHLSRNLKDKYQEANVLINIAALYDNNQNLIGAEKSIIRTINLLQSLPDSEDKFHSLVFAYNNMALNLSKLKKYDNAMEYYNRAMLLSDRISTSYYSINTNYETYWSIKINIAELHLKQHDFKKSIAIYHELLKDKSIFKKDPITYAAILNNLAHTRFLAKDSNHQEILDLFNRAYRISDSLNYSYEIAAIGNDLSEFYLFMGKKDSALHYLKRSLKVAKQAKDYTEVLRTLKLLSKANEGNAGKDYLYEYITLSDSILSEERNMRNKFARIQFETDEISAKNEVLTKDRNLLFTTIIALLISLILLYFYFAQRSKNKALLFNSEQQKANENIYALMLDQQSKLERSRIEERFRISENLHDGVLGSLFGIRTSFGNLGTQISGDANTLKKYQDYINHMQAVEKEIREVTHNLKDDILASKTNFETIIDYYVKELSELHALEYRLQSDENIPWDTIDDGLKVNLYRVVQESILNIIKHAEADNIEISFALQENGLSLSIKDDGIGFDVKKQHQGIGLKNLKSRAKKLNGKLSISSSPDHGTNITVKMPIKQIKRDQ